MHNIHQNEVAASELTKSDDFLNSDWSLLKYFGHAKVLTLDPTAERFMKFKRELAKVGLRERDVEIALGIPGNQLAFELWSRMVSWDIRHKKMEPSAIEERKRGQMGCYLGQYLAIKKSADNYLRAVDKDEVRRWSSLLLIEDNNGFGHVTGPLSSEMEDYGRRFRLMMRDLPEEWDMFYFVAWGEGKKVTDNLCKLKCGVLTKCYAINAKFYQTLLEALEKGMQGPEIMPVDNTIALLHKSANCYAALPSLAFRSASPSLVGGHFHKNKYTNCHWQPPIKLLAT